jgi:signal recognition particle subunit SRP54
MASLDTNRPAAMEQLAILGTQIGVDTLPIVKGQSRGPDRKRAKTQGDAGRLRRLPARHRGPAAYRRVLMAEVQEVRDIATRARRCWWSMA